MARQRRSQANLRDRAEQRGALPALVFARREELGLRQDEVADLAGCAPRFVHEVEAGKATVRLDKLVDLLSALGLHLEAADGARHGGVAVAPRLRAEYGFDPERDG